MVTGMLLTLSGGSNGRFFCRICVVSRVDFLHQLGINYLFAAGSKQGMAMYSYVWLLLN